MWNITGNNITMAEGDFGIKLPITITGTTLAAGDFIRLTIKKGVNGPAIVEKDYDTFSENTFDFELAEAESALLAVGSYVYSLDWYQDGNFMCNIIPIAAFKVVDKA